LAIVSTPEPLKS